MNGRMLLLGLFIAGVAAAAGWALFRGTAPAGNPRAAASPDPLPIPSWRGRFPNVPLQTHEGRTVRFYDDLLRGKIVTVNFFYVECDGTCPGVTSNLVKVQRELGSRAGTDVFILCITLQPQRDTPEKLKDYARRYGAGPGMLFLTGAPEDVELLRRALGFSYPQDPERDGDRSEHLGLLRMGNEPFDWWTACASLSSPAQICRLIRSLDGPEGARSELLPDRGPLENPQGVPITFPASAGTRDRRALDLLEESLDRLHRTRAGMEPSAYAGQVISTLAAFLDLSGPGATALGTALREAAAECREAKKRAETLRSRIAGDAEYRENWARYLDDRARAFRKIEAVLDSGPRHQVFRAQAARWLFYLEDHP